VALGLAASPHPWAQQCAPDRGRLAPKRHQAESTNVSRDSPPALAGSAVPEKKRCGYARVWSVHATCAYVGGIVVRSGLLCEDHGRAQLLRLDHAWQLDHWPDIRGQHPWLQFWSSHTHSPLFLVLFLDLHHVLVHVRQSAVIERHLLLLHTVRMMPAPAAGGSAFVDMVAMAATTAHISN